MLTKSNKMLLIAATAVVASTSSVLAFDPAREAQWQDAAQYATPYNARAEARNVHGQDRFVSPPMKAEPFTAAEKRAFQQPTGREVDSW